jgi:predicted O-linked N-acetylglucosamine transferase (SPINDLY family)
MHVREAWYSKFLAAGVSRERVELLPFADYVVGEINTHLASYSRIDIALDSLPYGGTTTIVEAALMGVPLITLKTPAHASLHSCNVGAGFNKSFGLGDLVAHSPAQFVDIARQVSSVRRRCPAGESYDGLLLQLSCS